MVQEAFGLCDGRRETHGKGNLQTCIGVLTGLQHGQSVRFGSGYGLFAEDAWHLDRRHLHVPAMVGIGRADDHPVQVADQQGMQVGECGNSKLVRNPFQHPWHLIPGTYNCHIRDLLQAFQIGEGVAMSQAAESDAGRHPLPRKLRDVHRPTSANGVQYSLGNLDGHQSIFR